LRVIRRTDRQTDRQTDRTKNITSFFGGGNKRLPAATKQPSISMGKTDTAVSSTMFGRQKLVDDIAAMFTAQAPSVPFVVDLLCNLLYNLLYSKLYNKSTTNRTDAV